MNKGLTIFQWQAVLICFWPFKLKVQFTEKFERNVKIFWRKNIKLAETLVVKYWISNMNPRNLTKIKKTHEYIKNRTFFRPVLTGKNLIFFENRQTHEKK